MNKTQPTKSPVQQSTKYSEPDYTQSVHAVKSPKTKDSRLDKLTQDINSNVDIQRNHFYQLRELVMKLGMPDPSDHVVQSPVQEPIIEDTLLGDLEQIRYQQVFINDGLSDLVYHLRTLIG